MRRRLQFRLRTLLGFATLICLFLGGWHLLETYGYRIEVNGTRFKGRCIRVFGPAKRHLVLAARAADGTVPWTHERDVERSWLCCYDFDWELGTGPLDERLTFDLCQWDKAPGGGFNLHVIKSKAIKVTE